MRAGITASPQRAVWHRAASTYWWMLLALSVVVSSYGNVRHAQSVAPVEHAVEAQWIAGALPVTLLLMVEGIAIGARAGLAGWQRRVATVAVGVLACVVLASSYVGLLSLVRATELFQVEALTLGLACVPDLLMVAATVYVMSLREPVDPGAAQVAPELSYGLKATVAEPVAEVADQLVAEPVEVADQPVVDQPAATTSDVADQSPATATTVADRPVAANEPATVTEVVDRPVVADEPATLDEVADSPVADHPPQVNAVAVEEPATVTEAADRSPATVSEKAVADSQGVADQPVADEVPATVELVADQPPATATTVADEPVADDEPASAPPVADGDVAAPEVADLARRVHEESATTKPLEDVAEVLELAEAGMSQRAIAAEVGVDRTLVSRWIKASQTLETREPQPVG